MLLLHIFMKVSYPRIGQARHERKPSGVFGSNDETAGMGEA